MTVIRGKDIEVQRVDHAIVIRVAGQEGETEDNVGSRMVPGDVGYPGSRNLRDYFQSKGYFDAQVEVKEMQEPSPDRRTVVYSIHLKERHKLVELTVEGNHYFDRETLRERMETQRAGGLLLYGLFSQTNLARDVQSIDNLYRANGFLQAKVVSNVVDDYQSKKGHIKVTIHIDEGAQTTVGKLTIEGNQAVSETQIRELVSTTQGQPYSQPNVVTDQNQVTNYYFNRGFPGVRFESFAKPEPDVPNKTSTGAIDQNL